MRDQSANIETANPMSREDFIRAMGGQEALDKSGSVVVECRCGHECCRGWDVTDA